MADGSELVKYVTKRVVHYVETPKEERRQLRKTEKQAKRPKEHWSVRWFGVAPLGIMIWWKNRKNNIKT